MAIGYWLLAITHVDQLSGRFAMSQPLTAKSQASVSELLALRSTELVDQEDVGEERPDVDGRVQVVYEL